jgi:hypothetical protein
MMGNVGAGIMGKKIDPSTTEGPTKENFMGIMVEVISV